MPPIDSEQYRQLVEDSPAMIWRIQSDGRRTYVNATWLAFTGRSREEERGDGWALSVHSEDVGDFRTVLTEHLQSQQPFTGNYRLRRFDGVYFQVVNHAAPYTDALGAFAGFIGYCQVVAERPLNAPLGVDEFFEMSPGQCLCRRA